MNSRHRASLSSGGCHPGSPSNGSGPCHHPSTTGDCWRSPTWRAAARRQRRAMLITESRAEAAEHIRHFQPLASHKPAVRRARGPARLARRECLQRTGRGADLAGGDHEISRRGAQIAMPEQQLDGAQIGAGLQQMNREGVAQRMRRDRLADAAPLRASRQVRSMVSGRPAGRAIAGEQPLSGMGALPIVPEHIKSLGGSMT